MSITDKNIVYEDFKYVLADAGNVSFGAKLTYEEMLSRDDVPFKFKSICSKYLFKDVDPETSLESLIYFMEPSGFPYECLKNLKCKIKYAKPEEKKGLFGKTSTIFKQYVAKIEDFAEMSAGEKEEKKIILQEVNISKLALMVFSD